MPTLYNEEVIKNNPDKYILKDRSEKRQGGVLQNWEIYCPYGTNKSVIVAQPEFDDEWVDSQFITTSLLVSINDDETEAETLNTIYKLGKKA